MPRKTRPKTPEAIQEALVELLSEFEGVLESGEVRDKVRALVPTSRLLRDLGGAILPGGPYRSAKARILAYLHSFWGGVIDGDELMVVSGISEYARRIRELRVEGGWPILSGHTARELRESMKEDGIPEEEWPPRMRVSQYCLQADEPDKMAAARWKVANQIRRDKGGVRDKILRYLQANVGQRVTSEELRYVSGTPTEWARRSRELRTEGGWPVVTRFNGDPTLPVGVYILAENEQAPPHDRRIPELVRREVMKRDNWSCRWVRCGWPQGYDTTVDHRYLEVHHVEQHVKGGSSKDPDNLVTLCNLHHDETHRSGSLNLT